MVHQCNYKSEGVEIILKKSSLKANESKIPEYLKIENTLLDHIQWWNVICFFRLSIPTVGCNGGPQKSFFTSSRNLCCIVLSRSVVSISANPSFVAHQAPLSMGILQARILEWICMPSSRGSSQPRSWTQVSCIVGGFFTIWANREA